MIPPRYIGLDLLFHLQRREQRADPVADLVRRQRSPSTRLSRPAVLVVGDQRLGLLVVLARAGGGSPRACRRRGRSSGAPQTSQTPSFFGGSNSTWKMWPFLAQVRRPPSRRTTSSSGTSISSAAVSSRPSSSELLVERLGLRLGAREAVEDEAVLGLRARRPLGDHADDHLVGDEVAAVHVLLRLAAELGLRRAPRRAGCRRSRSRAAGSPPAGARPGFPCPTRAGRGG